MCTITEIASGATETVTVTTVGSPQTVTIGAGGTGTANVTDTYEFVPGSLVVDKTIAGPSAGQQGEVTISVICAGVALPDFVIPAGAAAGTVSQTYDDIPGETSCTINEAADGRTLTVAVTTVGSGQAVVVPAGGTVTAALTDTYDPAPGALLVRKTITGAAAGRQGPITITVVCGETALPDFVIPSGTAAGTMSHGYVGIPAGASCRVRETADGTTTAVDVEVDDPEETVTIPAGGLALVALTNTIADAPGTLVVTKTLAGPAAGQQGRVAILVHCGGQLHTFAFLIPAATAAGPVPRSFDDVPAGSTCTVTEVVDGGTATVRVLGVGSGQQVVVPAGGTVTADLTDTFRVIQTPVPGTLPATGEGDSARTLMGAAIALITGTALLVVSRRRGAVRTGMPERATNER